MAIVVIGGQSHNIGKTSVVCAFISALPERRWTAIKITQSDHDLCVANGGLCQCETPDHVIALSEEHDCTTGTDSSRYLAAGAVRSVWLRTRRGQLAEAIPQVRNEIARAENVLFESNSILEFLKPDFYASVLNPEVSNFKPSALRYLDRANALLLCAEAAIPAWDSVSLKRIVHIPSFRIAPPDYASGEFAAFVSQALGPGRAKT
jgi:molybdopterin-guanine dinucleotide biosynthesis protein